MIAGGELEAGEAAGDVRWQLIFLSAPNFLPQKCTPFADA